MDPDLRRRKVKLANGHDNATKTTGWVGSIGLPNLITIARLLAVPLVVWLVLAGRMTPAFWIFVLAGLSDAADGFIAKRFNCVTEFGRYLDPIADKALLVSVYVTLGHAGHLPTWLVILVVFRDALIVGGILFLRQLDGPVRLQPLFISKLNTAMQIVLAAAVLAVLGIDAPDLGMVDVLILVVAATTTASGIAYLMRWGFGPAGVAAARRKEAAGNTPTQPATDDKWTEERVVG